MLKKNINRDFLFLGSSQANRKAENIVVENSVEDAEQRKVLKTEAVLSMLCLKP